MDCIWGSVGGSETSYHTNNGEKDKPNIKIRVLQNVAVL